MRKNYETEEYKIEPNVFYGRTSQTKEGISTFKEYIRYESDKGGIVVEFVEKSPSYTGGMDLTSNFVSIDTYTYKQQNSLDTIINRVRNKLGQKPRMKKENIFEKSGNYLNTWASTAEIDNPDIKKIVDNARIKIIEKGRPLHREKKIEILCKRRKEELDEYVERKKRIKAADEIRNKKAADKIKNILSR